MLLSFANPETFLSKVAAPTSIVLSSINFIFEKFGPSFMTTPLIPLSLISVFEPAPSIVIGKLYFLFSFINSINCSSFSGLKKYSAGPPKLNQL